MSRPNVNVNISLDLNKALGEVTSRIQDQNIPLGEAIDHIVNFCLRTWPHKNVMVVHSAHQKQLTGSAHAHVEIPTGWSTKGLEVYVFDEGTFQLVGQGGYNNWRFAGNYERDGKFVRFYPRRPSRPTHEGYKGFGANPGPRYEGFGAFPAQWRK